jgi:hypothetical protein
VGKSWCWSEVTFVPFYSWVQQQNNGELLEQQKREVNVTATATTAHRGKLTEAAEGSSGCGGVSTYSTVLLHVPDLKGSTSSMVSALRRQVGSLCVHAPFLCPADS